jgi:high-affinity iron transporter
LLAYLGAVGAQAKHRRQLWAGVAAGVVASVGTWFVAATLLPISGANRELLEGVTALIAVAVLLYVANWLFQKTYIHDWKDYLRERVGNAMTSGSAFAMAALAFAAVYREGFETVLFYQALAFDAGVVPILAGFIPGLLLIVVIGVAIIRMNARLPLKKVFGWTNAVLMYLAFVFLGKGLYNLQEGGVFSPHPLPLPDHPALRQLLGFYPVLETVLAQFAFLLLIAATYLWYRKKMSALAARRAPLAA